MSLSKFEFGTYEITEILKAILEKKEISNFVVSFVYHYYFRLWCDACLFYTSGNRCLAKTSFFLPFFLSLVDLSCHSTATFYSYPGWNDNIKQRRIDVSSQCFLHNPFESIPLSIQTDTYIYIYINLHPLFHSFIPNLLEKFHQRDSMLSTKIYRSEIIKLHVRIEIYPNDVKSYPSFFRELNNSLLTFVIFPERGTTNRFFDAKNPLPLSLLSLKL